MKVITRNVPSRAVDPFADFFGMYSNFDRILEGSPSAAPVSEADWRPAIDVHEEAEAFVLSVDLPGVKKGDVSLTVDEQLLVLKGERVQVKRDEAQRVHRAERVTGSFYRSFDLGSDVDYGAVSAVFSDGVLTVTVPKAKAPEPKEVQIAIQ